jgi:hypothetical protein
MQINDLNLSVFPLNVPENGALSSKDINVFSKSAANDIAAIASLLNNQISKTLSSLPEEFDPESDKLDGSSIYVDSAATVSKDYGIFYNQDVAEPRPRTIYETLLVFVQLLANIDNGLREGVKVGSFAAKQGIAAGQTLTLDWPYIDKMFKPLLFKYRFLYYSKRFSHCP